MPDVRLIDGKELKKHIESTICYGCEIGHMVPPCRRCYVSTVLRYIDEMPEVDAQPVKRGKWRLVVERVITSKYACSECDSVYAIPSELSPEGFYCYCPNCGAKMRR